MYDKLFGSKTRAKLLSLFFVNSDKSFYVREITRTIREQINSVRRELANLKSLELVVSHEKKGKLYYMVNKKADIYPELKRIFNKVTKDEINPQADLSKEIKKLGDVAYASLMGYFVKDHSSALDLFLVGKIDRRKLKTLIARLEKEARRELNYTVMTVDEHESRKMMFDRFLTEILAAPKEVLLDYLEENGEEDLGKRITVKKAK